MDNAIVPLDSLSLTALVHRGTKWRRTFWEATCPELDISVRAEGEAEARAELQTAVQEFLQTASAKEIEESLDNGTTYSLAPLTIAPIVRDDEAELSWLQRVPVGALTAAGAAKDKAGDLAASVAGAASTSGRFVAGTASSAYGTVSDLASNVYARTNSTLAQHTAPLLIGLTGHAGTAAEMLTDNPSLQQLAKKFKIEQWLDVSGRVNIEESERVVAELKASYPTESDRQIARRLIGQKALYAGGVGLSTSILPGAAVPLLALDMATHFILKRRPINRLSLTKC